MAQPFVYVSGYDSVISCFTLDPASGALTPASRSDGGRNPSYLAWNPARTRMYAINEAGEGRVTAFAIDPRDGALKRISDASAGGRGPCHVAVHPSGRWVFAANYGSGHVAVLPVREDGGVGEPVDVQLAGKNAHMTVCDASGCFVFVPCLGSDHVAQYRFDPATGRLTPNQPASVPTAKGAGPRHLALAPALRSAYLIDELDSTMATLDYDPAQGLLTVRESQSTLPAGAARTGNSTAHVLASPSGRFLYGSNRGNDSIAIYAIDPVSGRLTLKAHETGGGEIRVPRDFTIDPSGGLLLAASQKADLVTVFRIDPASGLLARLGATAVPPGPSFVGVMPRP
jgi:6-phosphogluconolactonase